MQKKGENEELRISTDGSWPISEKANNQNKTSFHVWSPFWSPFESKNAQNTENGRQKTSQNQHLARFWRMFGGC